MTEPRMNTFFTAICGATGKPSINRGGLGTQQQPQRRAAHTHQLRETLFVHNLRAIQLEVHVLVHGVDSPSQGQVILQFHDNYLAHQRLEE